MSNQIEFSVGLARGIEGRMQPCHEGADSADAITLLKYAVMIENAADEPMKKPTLTRPVILLASLIAAVLLGCLAAWIASFASGVPMEWPQ